MTTTTRTPPRQRAARPPNPPPRRPSAAVVRRRPQRRLIGLLVVIVLAFATVAARVTQLQLVAPDRYVAVGESQRVRNVQLPAERGTVFDREGRELALSVRQSTVWADPRLVSDPLRAAEALAPLLQVDQLELQSKLTQDKAFVYLARKVDDETAQRVRNLGLPGISLLDEPERFLPAGALAAPLIGKVGLDNNGLSGLESQYEKQLRGLPGQVVVERDPQGRDIPGGVRSFQASVQGDDLVLTIDRAVQYELERALAGSIVQHSAKGGMAIVMEAQTGEVLAMANLTRAEDGTVGPAANNMALTNVYEPGSVNKMITVAGALEDKVVKPNERLLVHGTIRVADHTFLEHDPHPPMEWSITDIVANSSNVGSIMIGQRLGKTRLDHYMRAFGFGKKTGLGFPGESAGLLLDPKKYSGTSMGTMPIGQGVAVTAVQMLAAYNTVANDGVYVAPKLVKAVIDSDGSRKDTEPSERRRVISSRTARQMTAMLNEVVRVGTGTRAGIDGYTVAGKTGTARKPLENARGYEEGAYVSSFAGFVPSERPALSAIVILDEPFPIFGGVVAAPVFADVMRYSLRQYRIPPPAPAAPPAAVPAASAAATKEVGEAGSPSSVPPTSIAPTPSTPSP
ncbi:MAG TPA: penicillin-binding protein 2 [Acidimicrobiales bacterium]|nr:penicillin-binding protein 2 [Acidimicrobiales bacterium]